MLRVNKDRGPCSRFRVEIANVGVYLPFLTRPRRIDDPEVLYGAPVHDPPNDQLTRAANYLPVLGKVGVLDIPGSDQAAKDLRLIAQRGMRAQSLECRNHV